MDNHQAASRRMKTLVEEKLTTKIPNGLSRQELALYNWHRRGKILAIARARGHCEVCGKYVGTHHLTRHHIIKPFQGGSHSEDNSVMCCNKCYVRFVKATAEEFKLR